VPPASANAAIETNSPKCCSWATVGCLLRGPSRLWKIPRGLRGGFLRSEYPEGPGASIVRYESLRVAALKAESAGWSPVSGTSKGIASRSIGRRGSRRECAGSDSRGPNPVAMLPSSTLPVHEAVQRISPAERRAGRCDSLDGRAAPQPEVPPHREPPARRETSPDHSRSHRRAPS
jgi:hypothetical protein